MRDDLRMPNREGVPASILYVISHLKPCLEGALKGNFDSESKSTTNQNYWGMLRNHASKKVVIDEAQPDMNG